MHLGASAASSLLQRILLSFAYLLAPVYLGVLDGLLGAGFHEVLFDGRVVLPASGSKRKSENH